MSDSEDEDEPEVLVVEQYVQRVLDFSSQYGSDQSYSYTASNLIGKPTFFPSYGDSPITFAQREFSTAFKECPSGRVKYQSYCAHQCPCDCMDNFVDVRFEHAVYAHAIYIFETFNPGAVHQIWGGNCRGRWALLYSGATPPSPVGHQPRAFSPPISTPDFPVNMVRLVFSNDHIHNYSEIEAVALLGVVTKPRNLGWLEMAEAEWEALKSLDLSNAVKRAGLMALTVDNLADNLALDLSSMGASLLLGDRTSDEHHDVGADEEGAATGIDHFQSLPGEVILHVFSFLDLISLTRCASVCKLFKKASSDPRLYTRLCLKSLFYLVNTQCLVALTEKAKFLHSLDLSWVGNYGQISSASLWDLILHCSVSLVALRLNNCHSVDGSVMETITTHCTALQNLSLSNCHLIDSEDFEDLYNVKNLRRLNLYRTRINKSSILKFLLLNDMKLTHLNVSSCGLLHGDELCKLLKNHAPHLVALEMFRIQNLTSRGVFHIAKLIHLQELDVGWCNTVDHSTGCVLELIQNCRQLRKLFLTAHRQTSDSELSALCDLEHLSQLDVMGTRNVSYPAVKNLLERCDGLVLLDISYCEQLESSVEDLVQLKKDYPRCNVILSHSGW